MEMRDRIYHVLAQAERTPGRKCQQQILGFAIPAAVQKNK